MNANHLSLGSTINSSLIPPFLVKQDKRVALEQPIPRSREERRWKGWSGTPYIFITDRLKFSRDHVSFLFFFFFLYRIVYSEFEVGWMEKIILLKMFEEKESVWKNNNFERMLFIQM